MPALAEFLVMVGSSGSQYLSEIHKLPRFEIGDFNEKAAIEVSMAIRKALDSLGKEKRDGVKATWAKVNFDRQIVAIAKAKGCSAIYSTDRDVRNLAAKMGLDCIHLADLPLPPDQSPVAQLTLKLLPPAETAEPVTPGRQILQIPVVEVIPPVPTANGAAGEEGLLAL